MSTNSRTLLKLIHDQQPIDLSVGYNFVRSPKCGAIHTFTGTIRDTDLDNDDDETKHNVPIRGIFYEAYVEMLVKQLERMLENTVATSSDSNVRLALTIRLGFVPIGEASIAICVSSTGRQYSHQCTMSLLNEIKSKAVVWKKIVYTDGREQWDPVQKSEAHWLANKETITTNDDM